MGEHVVVPTDLATQTPGEEAPAQGKSSADPSSLGFLCFFYLCLCLISISSLRFLKTRIWDERVGREGGERGSAALERGEVSGLPGPGWSRELAGSSCEFLQPHLSTYLSLCGCPPCPRVLRAWETHT